eukprot:3408996-Pyramimonas_sp.AAC.1
MGNLSRSGGLASIGYTAKAQGMSDTQVQKVRARSGHAELGSAQGRSRTIEFLLSHCPRSDPTIHCGRVPVGVLAQNDMGAVGQAEGDGPGIHARREPHALLA